MSALDASRVPVLEDGQGTALGIAKRQFNVMPPLDARPDLKRRLG